MSTLHTMRGGWKQQTAAADFARPTQRSEENDVYDFATTVAQPYPLLMILLGLTILFAWLKREGRLRGLAVITLAWLAIYLISAPIVANAMLESLTHKHHPPAELPPGTDAIVTLGGGVVPTAQFRETPQVDSVSFGRCLHTAAIYEHVKPCAIIVCGGVSDKVPDGPSVAEVMRDALIRFGVDENDILIETRSDSTYENAINAAKILRDHGLERPVLVTDARHMPRSVMCFRKQGVDIVPAPSDFSFEEVLPPLYERILPTSDGLRASHKTFHEWLGMAWYWVNGRI